MSSSPLDPLAKQALGQRSAIAFGWGVAASIAKVLVTLVVQAILARLLGPNEFGLFAIGILVMGVAAYFADMGLATSLVQQTEVLDEDIRFVLTLNVLSACLVGLLVATMAHPLAQLFDKPALAAIFPWLAPVFVINAVASVSTSLLRRQMDYRSIQLANLVGYVVGFGVVGVGFAFFLGTVMALVAAFLVQAMLTLALLYRKARHPLRFGLHARDRSRFIGFGATVLLTNLVNWTIGALDRVLVGRLFSAATLGQYSAAYNLVVAPVGGLYPNLQSTAFSAMARMQEDLPRLQRAYQDLLRVVMVLFLPAFSGMFFFTTPLVRVVYGAQWDQAALLAGPFCLLAPFMLVWACATPVLWNTGHKSKEWQLQLPFILLSLAVVLPMAALSISAVAWSAAGLYVARALLMAGIAFKVLRLGLAAIGSTVWPGLWMSIMVGLLALLSSRCLQAAALPAGLQLLAGLAIVGLSAAAAILLAPKSLPPAARLLIGRLYPALPPWLRPLLNRLTGEHDQRS